jgi:hypothetical protein
MKKMDMQVISAFVLGVALSGSAAQMWAQQTSAKDTTRHEESAGQNMHDAGQKTKDAAKDVGEGTKKETKKAYNATKKVTKKAYSKTKDTTKGAVDGAKEGAKKPE